jgi:hypothetical protein
MFEQSATAPITTFPQASPPTLTLRLSNYANSWPALGESRNTRRFVANLAVAPVDRADYGEFGVGGPGFDVLT